MDGLQPELIWKIQKTRNSEFTSVSGSLTFPQDPLMYRFEDVYEKLFEFFRGAFERDRGGTQTQIWVRTPAINETKNKTLFKWVKF